MESLVQDGPSRFSIRSTDLTLSIFSKLLTRLENLPATEHKAEVEKAAAMRKRYVCDCDGNPRQTLINGYGLELWPIASLSSHQIFNGKLNMVDLRLFIEEVSLDHIKWGRATWKLAAAVLGNTVKTNTTFLDGTTNEAQTVAAVVLPGAYLDKVKLSANTDTIILVTVEENTWVPVVYLKAQDITIPLPVGHWPAMSDSTKTTMKKLASGVASDTGVRPISMIRYQENTRAHDGLRAFWSLLVYLNHDGPQEAPDDYDFIFRLFSEVRNELHRIDTDRRDAEWAGVTETVPKRKRDESEQPRRDESNSNSDMWPQLI